MTGDCALSTHQRAAVQALVAPFLTITVVVGLASLCVQPRPWAHGEPLPKVCRLAVLANRLVAGYGPLLVLVIFALQWLCLPYGELAKRGVIHSQASLYGMPLQLASFIALVLVALLRLVLFLAVRRHNYYFSDHIFLICSLVGMISMKLYLAHHDTLKHGASTRSLLIVVVGWFLILLCAFEAFFTTVYFHTLQASWTALAVGAIIFGVLPGVWIEKVLKPEKELEEATEPLNQDSSLEDNSNDRGIYATNAR